MAAEALTTVKTKRLLFGGLAAIVLLAVGWIGWRAWDERARVGDGVPDKPDLQGRSAELEERVTAADAAARGWVHPVRGLAELSRLYHANGLLDEALLCYTTLERAEPQEARWPHLAGCLLATAGRLDEAVPRYRRAVELAPDYLPARLRLGDVWLKQNHLAAAEKVYGEVCALQPDQPYALLGLARAAIAADGWQKARELLTRAIAADPEFVGGMSLLVTVHEHFGEKAEAAAMAERINHREFVDIVDPWLDGLIDDCYDAYHLSVAAAVAIFRGDTVTAERWLARAIALSSTPAPYYRQLGKMYYGTKNYPEARRNFEQATRLAPTDSDAWAMLVNLLLAMDERADAYRAVSAGLAKCPESRALHFVYGRMLKEDGRYVQAIAELQEAKRIQPGESNAYIELATVHFKLGEIEAGMAEMRGALRVQPDHPVALIVLARDAIMNGDRAAAQEWIRRAKLQVRVRPEDLAGVQAEFQAKFGAAP